MYDVIVIGGGASGMMAAGRAAELGKKVLLLEKNRTLGEKLKISGGGRCNVTNAEKDVHVFLKKYGAAEQFLYAPFAQFGVDDTFSFFEKHGLPLVIQARKRTFPHTEKAFDVFKILEGYIKKHGVEIRTSTPVTRIEISDEGAILAVHSKKDTYRASTYILATGGMSHPETGSTGDGFKWLKDIGHTIRKPTPTIVPVTTEEAWSKQLSGASLSFMKITFYLDGLKSFAEVGKILFTHFGLSGPLILNSAYKVADLLEAGAVTATIDAYPHTDLGALEKKIIAVFDANKNKTLKNVIKEFVPEGTHKGISILISEQIDISKKVNLITRDERKKIVHLLKRLPLTVTGLMGFDRAVVADGGVPLMEIDPKSMHSKKISNLFITGDLLHINRPSGGYSLQLCWTSGFVAGTHAAK
jgi:predicted Rossmann fold flavoprotein